MSEQDLLVHVLDEEVPVQEIKAWLDDAFEVGTTLCTAVLHTALDCRVCSILLCRVCCIRGDAH